MRIRIAGLQTAGTPRDIEANLAELDAAAAEAAREGADLLITPEMFITGYVVGDAMPRLAAQNFLPRAQEVARRRGVAVLLGAPESVDGVVYNAAYFIDDLGTVQSCYRKAHLFGDLDRAQFRAGDDLFGLVDFRGIRIASLICYDVEFPEAVRGAALAGAHLVAVPTAQMEPYSFVAEQLIRTRAWENQVYVAYINHDGVEEHLTYVGRSSIVAPDGTVLDAVEHGCRLVYATVDSDVVAKQRALNPYLDDRRVPIYGALTMTGHRHDA